MAGQHSENLFRRFRGETISIKTLSGGLYEGRVLEVTNDYICLNEVAGSEGATVYVFLGSLESMTAKEPST
jgi:hypothetical protein